MSRVAVSIRCGISWTGRWCKCPAMSVRMIAGGAMKNGKRRIAVIFIFNMAIASVAPSQAATKSPTTPQTPSPITMTECEGTNNCATWTFLGAQGIGQWPSGEISNLNVEHFDDNSVSIRRADPIGPSTGLTALYTGTRHGDRVAGGVHVILARLLGT